MSMQEYKLGSKYRYLLYFGLAFMVLMLVPALYIVVNPEGSSNSRVDNVIFSALSFIYLIFIAVMFKSLRDFSSNHVAVDQDGIWYLHLGKSKGLIPWNRICRVKERAGSQRLDLVDINDDILIKVSYQLEGFRALKAFIVDHIDMDFKVDNVSSSKNVLYHVGYVLSFLAILAGCFWLLMQQRGDAIWLMIMGLFMFLFCLYEYLTTSTGFKIDQDTLVITYPHTQRLISLKKIKDVYVREYSLKGNFHYEVCISLNRIAKPFVLRNVGMGSIELCELLKASIELSNNR
ncbi:hypothetical protein GT360_15775 [Vibrio astriarenae]|uniref:Uncharacterized protein n=1 Tax=Vibrio astriarenae TaxID=1481923 RepID=A0A7Z2T672_9VIBR|nr:hypothetical protein [Vibrio astriarenae]QIA65020.1 hypothetical protein GT360_15775 [Vibrio astriarenae]